MVFVLLILSVMLPAQFAWAEEMPNGLAISAPQKHRPFAQGEIILSVPWAGKITLAVKTGSEELPILAETQVEPGKLALPYWGLTTNGEPLPRGQATLTAKLRDGDRKETASAEILIQTPDAGLLYAVSSRDSLPRIGGEDLYVDYQLGKGGSLIVSLYQADDMKTPLFTKTLHKNDALPHAFRWDKTIKGEPAPAGDYVLTFKAKGSKQEALMRRVTLTDDLPETLTLGVTEKGAFLPTELDDKSVWAAMTAPLARVTIGTIAHQKVFERPDSKSQVLGVVHGQSAGLLVLQTDVNGFAKIRAARQGDGQWVTGYIPQDKIEVVRPHGTYGLLIDKAAQTISLYKEGSRVTTLKISTGIYVPPGTKSFETVPGAFLTQERIAEFPSEGYRYPYAMRLDGGNLLHSSGYVPKKGLRDFSSQQERLGGKASHGCVRIDNRANEDGYNAWWLYANLSRNTKVLVLPENWAEEGLLESLYDPGFLTIQGESDQVSHEPEPAPDYQVDESGSILEAGKDLPVDKSLTLTFGGDCVLGSEEGQRKLANSFDSVVDEKGYDWPFSGLYDLLSKDDLSMVNLEGVLKNDAGGLNKKLHNFRGPEDFAKILTLGSVEAVNIANNHFPDYGQDGKNSTRRALKNEGIGYSGYSDLFVFEKDGIKVGFGGIRETIYKQNHARIANEIKTLSGMGCSYIVYTCHFGNEYEESHNELQTEMARAAIDAGADLVIGHHPHLVQGIEEYKGGLIFYSLGNLVFGGNLEMTTFDGLLVQVEPAFANGTLIRTGVRLIPVITSGTRPGNDFRPVIATGMDKARILEAIQKDSAKPYQEYFVFRGK